MQTLILNNKNTDEIPNYNLFSFAANSSSSIILDSTDEIIIDKGKLYSKGEFNFIELEKTIEVFPSFVIFTQKDDEEKLKEIHKSILKWHPYCHEMFYYDKNFDEFFSTYLKKHKIKEKESNAEAYVHIASLKDRIIEVYKLNILDNSLENISTHISEQLKYKMSNIYNALVGSLDLDLETQIDKSIYLKVSFFVNANIDIELSLKEFEVINLENFNLVPKFNEHLNLIYNCLMQIKRDRNTEVGSNNKNYIRACKELNVDCEPITRNMYFLKKDGKKAVYIPYHRTVQNKTAINNAKSKVLTNEILEKAGLKISKHINISIDKIDTNFINTTFEELTAPFVIKPTDQSAGYGVFLNVKNKTIFKLTMEELKKLEKVDQLLIEEQFDGTLYRFLVIDNKVEAVLKANYPEICGDGKNPLRVLIQKYNKTNRRKIKFDNSTKVYLKSMNITLETVLKQGETIIASLKKNGDVIQNVTNFINEKYKKIALEANKAIGLKINGVDMMISKDGDYRIIELNPVPALYPHLEPNYGDSLDIFKKVIEYVLDNASNENYDCSEIYNYHN